MPGYLRVVQWNANGLKNHKAEVELFLNTNSIDVILVSETHLTDKDNFKINNYNTYSCTHPSGKSHGGSAILIKTNIVHHELNQFKEEYLQGTNISIQMMGGQLVLSAAYCPPRHKTTAIEFSKYIKYLGSKFVSGADWNAKHTAWAPG